MRSLFIYLRSHYLLRKGAINIQLKTIHAFYGFSQSQLADLLGVTQSFIAHVEAGRRPFTDSLRSRLMIALAITPDKLAQIVAIEAQYTAAREIFLK